jgi:hypothetical protein
MVENAKFETQLKIPGLHIASQQVKNCSGLLAGFHIHGGASTEKDGTNLLLGKVFTTSKVFRGLAGSKEDSVSSCCVGTTCG